MIGAPGRGPGEAALYDFGPHDRDPDVLFLHANGFNALTYRAILAELGARWRVLAIDQRGHGATTLSAEPEGRTDWLDMRDDLRALLPELAPAPVVLAGHSLGGAVSVMAAACEPDRVRALVLFDPVMIGGPSLERPLDSPMRQGALRRRSRFPSREAALEAYRGRGAFATWPDQTIADYLETGLAPDGEGGFVLACAPAWEASNYAAQANDTFGALAAWRGPTDILLAQAGSTFRPSGEVPARPGLAIETVPGTTHFLPMERPALAAVRIAAAIEGA